MAITTQDGLIAARATSRQNFTFMRTAVTNQSSGVPCSMYRAAGALPAQPAIPAAAAVPTKALAFNFASPGAGQGTYLDATGAVSTVSCVLTLYDRLFHTGGLNGTLATAQAVNSQTVLSFPARDAAAAECEWWMEWYADTGATATTANVAATYTDATTGTIAVALAGTRRAGMLMQIAPPQGKVIASVQSVTLAATTGTAGNFGVTCGRRLAGCALYLSSAFVGTEKEAVLLPVPDDACLWHVVHVNAPSTGDLRGDITLIQG